MTAFDIAVAQQDHPVMRVLDTLFAQVQQEQKFLHRRYMAVTELRGVAGRMMREGAAVALAVDGDDLVMRVTIAGLSGVAVDVGAGGGQYMPFDPVHHDLPSFLRPVAVAAELVPEDVAAEPAAAQDISPSPAEPLLGSRWTDAEDATLIDGVLVGMQGGLMQRAAICAASEAMGRTARAGLERVSRVLQPKLDARLAANPIEASGHIAAALTSDGRGKHGAWADMWSADEEARLVTLVVDGICAGKPKSLALSEAADVMGRTKKACEGRVYNRLAPAFAAELTARAVPDAATKPKPLVRKFSGGTVIGWTDADHARLVQIVADAICAGKTKTTGIADAALALGRPEPGVQFRILNKAKDDLAAELARRAGGVPAPAAAAPPFAPIVLPSDSPPPAVQVVSDGGSPPPAPVALSIAPAPEPATGKHSLQVAPAPAPPVVKQSLSADPVPVRRAPPPAIIADACPPRPLVGERVTQVAPPDDLAPVLAHLRAMTRGDAKALKSDFAIMHLACAGWKMGDIATDLGLDSKAVKQRFEALCGYEGGKGRFLRSHVYAAIEHLLTPAAVVA